MVRMIILGYPLIISLSILSQGFLFSFSKSIRKAESNDALLDTLALRKALRNGDMIEKSAANPQDHYSMDDSTNFNQDEESMKSTGSQSSYFSRDVVPLSVALNQIPFSALKSSARNSEAGDENVELIHERRDTGEEENAAKFPIGRRDFDKLYTSFKIVIKKVLYTGITKFAWISRYFKTQQNPEGWIIMGRYLKTLHGDLHMLEKLDEQCSGACLGEFIDHAGRFDLQKSRIFTI